MIMTPRLWLELAGLMLLIAVAMLGSLAVFPLAVVACVLLADRHELMARR